MMVGRHTVPGGVVGAAALGIVGLWLLPIVLFAVEPPCGGDLPCGPGLALVLLGPPALVYLVALGIWAAVDRVLPLLGMTALAAGVSVATLGADYVAGELRPLSGIVLLAPLVLVGSLETLHDHRIERWLTVAMLALVAVVFLASGVPSAAVLVALAAAVVTVAGPGRLVAGGSAVTAGGAGTASPSVEPSGDAASGGDGGRMP